MRNKKALPSACPHWQENPTSGRPAAEETVNGMRNIAAAGRKEQGHAGGLGPKHSKALRARGIGPGGMGQRMVHVTAGTTAVGGWWSQRKERFIWSGGRTGAMRAAHYCRWQKVKWSQTGGCDMYSQGEGEGAGKGGGCEKPRVVGPKRPVNVSSKACLKNMSAAPQLPLTCGLGPTPMAAAATCYRVSSGACLRRPARGSRGRRSSGTTWAKPARPVLTCSSRVSSWRHRRPPRRCCCPGPARSPCWCKSPLGGR